MKDSESNEQKNLSEDKRADGIKNVMDEIKSVQPSGLSKEQKERFRKIKAEVYEREKANRSQIIVFPSGKGWYKIGGASMLLYYYEIAQKVLRRMPRIQPDLDYGELKFRLGVISIRDPEAVQERIEKAGALKLAKREASGIFVYTLKQQCDTERLKDYIEELKFAQDRAMAVLEIAPISEAEDYRRIKHVFKRACEVVRKMREYDRVCMGYRIVAHTRKILQVYMLMAEGMVAELEAWREIYKYAKLLLNELGLTVDLMMWQNEIAVAIGTDVAAIKRLAERKLDKARASKQFRLAEIEL